jgi:hypothetical protein
VTAQGWNVAPETRPDREAVLETRIDLANLRFAEVGGKRTGALQTAVFCVDAKGHVVGDRWQRIDLSLTQDVYERLRQDGIPYVAHVALTAQARFAKLVVYDPNADLVGTVQITLR